VTSDSLSAWLAGLLRARRLVLIKRCEIEDGGLTASGLAGRGIVDPAFPSFLAASKVPGFLVGPDEPARFAEAMRRDTPVGREIMLVAASASTHHGEEAGASRD
jgi:5-(aminomethyl)-3-furanmethanol phosphate kinase